MGSDRSLGSGSGVAVYFGGVRQGKRQEVRQRTDAPWVVTRTARRTRNWASARGLACRNVDMQTIALRERREMLLWRVGDRNRPGPGNRRVDDGDRDSHRGGSLRRRSRGERRLTLS